MVSPGCDSVVTPLGEVNISNIDETNIVAHQNEHSLKMQIIFLQKLFKDVQIYPILVSPNKISVKHSLNELLNLINEDTLVVVSTDLSHYHDLSSAKEIDKQTINNILNLDEEGDINACGDNCIKLLLQIAKELDWSPELVKYSTSYQASKDKTNVVGYTTILFK
jgi:AmmeMemoRadiSam system protein B